MIHKVRDWPAGYISSTVNLAPGKLEELERMVLRALLADGKLPATVATIRIHLEVELGVLSKPEDEAAADLEMFQYKVRVMTKGEG